MAINPNISLAGQPLDVMSSIRGGLAAGESIRQMGVRDAILKQQQQIGQFNLEQAKQQKALQGMQQFGSVVEGLSSIPDLAQRAKVLAQQIPMLEEIGIPASRLSSLDLSNEGLKSVQMQLRPFMEQKEKEVAALPSDVQSFQSFISVLDDPNASEDEKKAARIQLKLDAPAKDFAPKIVEIGGSKYLQVGKELFHPTTYAPVTLDNQGAPIESGEAVEPEVLTPEAQRESEAEAAAAVTSATEQAKAEVRAAEKEPEKEEDKQQEIEQAQKTMRVIDSIMGSTRLDNITGLTGKLPFSTTKTQDLLGEVQQLTSLLTADNLSIMTGVLSESDIKIIEGLSNDIGLIKNDKGEITGIKGSYDGTINKLKQIRREIQRGANKNGFYFEGQTITNPDTGERLQFRNGEWVSI